MKEHLRERKFSDGTVDMTNCWLKGQEQHFFLQWNPCFGESLYKCIYRLQETAEKLRKMAKCNCVSCQHSAGYKLCMTLVKSLQS